MRDSKHEEKSDLTSGEVGYLWESYQYESMQYIGIQFFLQHVHDKQTEKLLQKAMNLSEKRINQIQTIFTEEDYPIPEGYSEGDVNLKAPRLFSDKLYLKYLLHTLQMESVFYSSAMLGVVKFPIQRFYQEIMQDTLKLEMATKELVKSRGLYLRSPKVSQPKTICFVEKDSFLSGWFGDKRPLLAIEIEALVFNAKRNALGEAVITAFCQVAKSKEVRQYFMKGKAIAKKHVDIFTEFLREDDLDSSTLLLTDEVTASTESPFSDKFMMNFITLLITSGLGEYGSSMAMSPRRDIGMMYARLMAEIAKYSNSGAGLLIKNGWMEQPPMAIDREKIIKKESE
ncbi:MAG TPA: DUF3231 family protein [Pseudogracilibacillus sp.]|nr:DUF3231 family protein [Pseudogracilibacillus sp.]